MLLLNIFLTRFISCLTCRWKSGVASSLNYIEISDEKSPVLHPYPSWEANQLPSDANSHVENEHYGGGRTDAKVAEKVDNILDKNNSTIISTFRIRVDECDRLWVMDSGKNNEVHADKVASHVLSPT